MKEKMHLTKTCGFYASDLHFAMVIFPFIYKEIKNGAQIHTVLEKNEQKNIDKIIENIGCSYEEKEQVRKVDWRNTTIKKIKELFVKMEEEIVHNQKITIVINGKKAFIEKVNKAVDLWMENHEDLFTKRHAEIQVINCYEVGDTSSIEEILHVHEFLLKTEGIEEIIKTEQLLPKAN